MTEPFRVGILRELFCGILRVKPRNTIQISLRGVFRNVPYLSAQKASASEGARLQKKNENAERKKRTEKKTRQRQKTSFLLIFQRISRIAGAFYPGTRRPDLAFTLSVAVFLKIFARMGKQPCGDSSLIRQERPKRHKKTGEKREKDGRGTGKGQERCTCDEEHCYM